MENRFADTSLDFITIGESPKKMGAGQWITIGSKKDDKGKKRGGARVYIEDGRITRGPEGMKGNKPSDPFARKSERTKQEAKERRKRGLPAADSKLGRAIESAVGDDLNDQEGFQQIVNDVWRRRREQMGEFESSLSDAINQFVPKEKRGSFVREVRNAEDVTTIPHFDEIVEHVVNEHPHILDFDPESSTSDPEDALFRIIQKGKIEAPPKHDEEVIREALDIAESMGFGQEEEEEDEELEAIPFSLRPWVRYRLATQQTFDFDEEKHPRDESGKFTSGIGVSSSSVEESKTGDKEEPSTEEGKKPKFKTKSQAWKAVDKYGEERDLDTDDIFSDTIGELLETRKDPEFVKIAIPLVVDWSKKSRSYHEFIGEMAGEMHSKGVQPDKHGILEEVVQEAREPWRKKARDHIDNFNAAVKSLPSIPGVDNEWLVDAADGSNRDNLRRISDQITEQEDPTEAFEHLSETSEEFKSVVQQLSDEADRMEDGKREEGQSIFDHLAEVLGHEVLTRKQESRLENAIREHPTTKDASAAMQRMVKIARATGYEYTENVRVTIEEEPRDKLVEELGEELADMQGVAVDYEKPVKKVLSRHEDSHLADLLMNGFKETEENRAIAAEYIEGQSEDRELESYSYDDAMSEAGVYENKDIVILAAERILDGEYERIKQKHQKMQSEPVWRTIGAKTSTTTPTGRNRKTPKKKGGVKVLIQDGEIIKGPSKMIGNSPNSPLEKKSGKTVDNRIADATIEAEAGKSTQKGISKGEGKMKTSLVRTDSEGNVVEFIDVDLDKARSVWNYLDMASEDIGDNRGIAIAEYSPSEDYISVGGFSYQREIGNVTPISQETGKSWRKLTDEEKEEFQGKLEGYKASGESNKETNQIETRIVNTKEGKRHVYSWLPPRKFWDLRKQGKIPGDVSVSKNQDGIWEATIWGKSPEHANEIYNDLKKTGAIHTVIRPPDIATSLPWER